MINQVFVLTQGIHIYHVYTSLEKAKEGAKRWIGHQSEEWISNDPGFWSIKGRPEKDPYWIIQVPIS